MLTIFNYVHKLNHNNMHWYYIIEIHSFIMHFFIYCANNSIILMKEIALLVLSQNYKYKYNMISHYKK